MDVAVVLAAGGGTRFAGAGHKLDAVIDGRSVLDRSIEAAIAAAIGPVVVVTGAAITTLLPPSVLAAVNDRWAEGQMTSLHAGIAAARDLGAAAVVVGLGDQPFVSREAWRAVAGSDAPIAVATYGGRRGHPVRLAAETWDLLGDGADEGARTLMRLRPELVTEVPCEGSSIDIDTVEDLRRWQKSSSTSSPSTGPSTKPGR